ncbi:hypothetical protein M758_7G106500 [Ceratodon purpureus]|nr:hypothetical protein M758_7G106500 [Ceratodon purpureus]
MVEESPSGYPRLLQPQPPRTPDKTQTPSRPKQEIGRRQEKQERSRRNNFAYNKGVRHNYRFTKGVRHNCRFTNGYRGTLHREQDMYSNIPRLVHNPSDQGNLDINKSSDLNDEFTCSCEVLTYQKFKDNWSIYAPRRTHHHRINCSNIRNCINLSPHHLCNHDIDKCISNTNKEGNNGMSRSLGRNATRTSTSHSPTSYTNHSTESLRNQNSRQQLRRSTRGRHCNSENELAISREGDSESSNSQGHFTCGASSHCSFVSPRYRAKCPHHNKKVSTQCKTMDGCETQTELPNVDRHGYVKNSCKYLVTENLEVYPSSNSLALLKKLKVENMSSLNSSDPRVGTDVVLQASNDSPTEERQPALKKRHRALK